MLWVQIPLSRHNIMWKSLSVTYCRSVVFSGFWFMVFNATLNNISVILWWSVLLVEETEVPGENHRANASHSLTNWKLMLQRKVRGRRGYYYMIVWITTACSISAYNHQSCDFELRSCRGVLDTTLCVVVVSFIGGGNRSTRRKPPS
jgi:hypothetical protein